MVSLFGNKSDEEVSDHDLVNWISIAKKILWRSEYRRRLEENGISLTPARFYNQIPTLKELEEGFENIEAIPYEFPFLSKRKTLESIEKLSKFNSEFDPPLEALEGFYWKNPAFTFTDAMAYYCFVRLLAPAKVWEIGSGYSTIIAEEAAKRNANTSVTCIEPYPKEFLRDLNVEIMENFVQNYNAEFFNDNLADGDILFIDSTHTVKASSDCRHIYLRVLPKIQRNIVVHVHDIALPRGMSINNAKEKHIYWTEQHLLAAYMLDNPKVDFLFGSVYANLVCKKEVTALMQNKYQPGGGSFWFELNGRFPSHKL